nr:MAG TPA: hypothetical protein [Caudoviricetes sp.]
MRWHGVVPELYPFCFVLSFPHLTHHHLPTFVIFLRNEKGTSGCPEMPLICFCVLLWVQDLGSASLPPLGFTSRLC